MQPELAQKLNEKTKFPHTKIKQNSNQHLNEEQLELNWGKTEKILVSGGKCFKELVLSITSSTGKGFVKSFHSFGDLFGAHSGNEDPKSNGDKKKFHFYLQWAGMLCLNQSYTDPDTLIQAFMTSRFDYCLSYLTIRPHALRELQLVPGVVICLLSNTNYNKHILMLHHMHQLLIE